MKTQTVFVVESNSGGQRRVLADTLTVTENGWLKFMTRGKLSGVFRDSYWTRCFVEAPKESAE